MGYPAELYSSAEYPVDRVGPVNKPMITNHHPLDRIHRSSFED